MLTACAAFALYAAFAPLPPPSRHYQLLEAAILADDRQGLQRLLQRRCDPNARSPHWGMTPLALAAAVPSSPRLVEILLQAGADPAAPAFAGGTALMALGAKAASQKMRGWLSQGRKLTDARPIAPADAEVIVKMLLGAADAAAGVRGPTAWDDSNTDAKAGDNAPAVGAAALARRNWRVPPISEGLRNTGAVNIDNSGRKKNDDNRAGSAISDDEHRGYTTDFTVNPSNANALTNTNPYNYSDAAQANTAAKDDSGISLEGGDKSAGWQETYGRRRSKELGVSPTFFSRVREVFTHSSERWVIAAAAPWGEILAEQPESLAVRWASANAAAAAAGAGSFQPKAPTYGNYYDSNSSQWGSKGLFGTDSAAATETGGRVHGRSSDSDNADGTSVGGGGFSGIRRTQGVDNSKLPRVPTAMRAFAAAGTGWTSLVATLVRAGGVAYAETEAANAERDGDAAAAGVIRDAIVQVTGVGSRRGEENQ